MEFKTISVLYLLLVIVSAAMIQNKLVDEKFETFNPVPDSVLLKQDKNFWYDVGTKQLKKMLIRQYEKELDVAKNVIIFIGDGMGISTITSTRIYKGQRQFKKSGEEHSLIYEDFPNIALVKTYNVDMQVPDSAATATALFTGIKTRYEAVGVDVNSYTDKLHDTFESSKVDSIMTWAQNEGKDTGIITTTRITHATPAATYAHSFYRYKECDVEVLDTEKQYFKDIARQLIEDAPGKNFKVILGGGQAHLGYTKEGSKCARKDGYNLTNIWLELHNESNSVFATNNEDLNMVNENTEYLLGAFSADNMPYNLVRDKGPKGTPTLSEMTYKGLQVLKKSPRGFILMVEGGMIDQAHHKNYARLALEESSDFDEAVSIAINETGPETLILVTADHSHTFTLNGYGRRGNDILGFGTTNDYKPKRFLSLSYANGPGFDYHYMPNDTETSPWKNVEKDETRLTNPYYQNTAALMLPDETHGGEDVAIYAKGPQSQLINGVFEQNYIAHFISYASCIGPHKNLNVHCKHLNSNAIINSKNITVLLIALLFHLVLYR